MADTTTTIIYIFIICILSFILFLLNGCETAITTLNTLRFKAYISQKVSVVKQKQLYIRIIKIIKNFNQTIITILTGVTLCSTISATVATFLLEKVLQKDDLVTLVIFGLALFLLFFAEALPKIIAKNHPEKYLLSFYWIIIILQYIFYPIIKLLEKIHFKREHIVIPEIEFITAIRSASNNPKINAQERHLVESAFRFDDKNLEKVYVPLKKVRTLNYNSTWKDLQKIFLKDQYSRIPIWNQAKTNFIGYINYKKVMQHLLATRKLNKNINILRFILPIKKVAIDMSLDKVLTTIIGYSQHMIAVTDQQQRTIGIVTLEDLLEEIIGEIYDEKDIHTDHNKKTLS